MTQLELSAALDVDCNVHLQQSDVSEVELQQRAVKDYELKAIAEVLEVEVAQILSH